MDKRLQLLLELKDKVTAPLRGIQAGSQDAAAALKATRDQVREMEKAQRDITGLRTTTVQLRSQQRELQALQGKLAQTNGQLTDARERHKNITASLKTSREAHARMTAALQNGAEATPAFIGQLEQTRISLLSSQRAYERSKSTLNQYRAQIKNTQGNIQQLSGRINNGQERLQGYKQRLEQAGISTDRLGLRSKELRSRIDQGSASIDRQKQALARLHEQQEKISALKAQHGKAMVHASMAVGTGMAFVAGGRTMARPVQATLGAYSQQEDASVQLQASMMQADGSVPKEFAQIEALAKRLGDRLPGTTADFIDLMTVLRKEGISTQAILGGTGEAAALLGVQLKMPVADAAAFAAKMQDATQATEGEMLGLMDVLQKNAYLGADQNYQLGGITAMAGAMGLLRLKGEEAYKALSPMLVMMNQAGMTDGASAGNAINKVFEAGLDTKKLEKANAVLAGTGIKLNFADKNGRFAGVENFFSQLEKLKQLGDNDVKKTAVFKELFGTDKENRQVLNNFIAKGYAGYQETIAKMEAQASLQQRVEQQLRTLTNVKEAAEGGFTNVVSSIGATVADDAKTIIDAIGAITGRIGDWVKEHPVLTATIVRAVAVLAALTAGLGMLMIPLGLIYGKVMLLRFAFGLLGFKLPSLLAGIKGVAAMVARFAPILARAAPMLLRILGPIGLLVTAGWMLYSNWDAICGGAKALWQDLGDWWNGFSARMASILSGMWNAVVSTAQGVLAGLVEGVRNLLDGGVGAWMAALLNFSPFGVLWNAITAALSALGIQVPEQFRNFGSFIVDGLIGGIQSKLSALKEAVVGAASSAASWFKERLGIASPSKLFTQYGGWISEGAANGIESGQSKLRAAALAMAGAASVGMPAFAATAELPPGLIDHRPAITLPKFAAAPEMPAVAIDRRPAIAAPAAMRPAVTIQGDNITMHIHSQPGMDTQALAQAISAELQRREYAKAARLQNAFNDFG